VKPYCASCGSTQYLKHLGDCQDFKVPILWPAPLEPEPEMDLETAFALIEAVSEAELEEVMARLVEEGKYERAGVGADGRARYRRLPQPEA